jgi:FMN phosphatase YigB (HAD superfamily)
MRLTHKIKSALLLPRLLRWRVRDIDNLERFTQLKSAGLVSLDVFDTALLRSVAQPRDVLALAAWRTERRLGHGISLRTMVEARIAAEAQARQAALAEGREEVTMNEIYSQFGSAFEDVRLGYQSEELATERDVCYANPAILALYRKLIAAGTDLAFISDTSLPQEFIETLLVGNGYRGPHRVFLSSAFGKTKARGGLYRSMCSQIGIEPSRIWHIGDNSHSDVLQARRFGVNGLWYRPTPLRSERRRFKDCENEQGIARSLITGISALHRADCYTEETPWRKLGFTIAGPLYLGFVQWLIGRLAEFKSKRIYFLSRDGLIAKRVYDELRPLYNAPLSSYLMISRRAVVLPGMTRVDEPALEFLCGNQLDLLVKQYLSRIGMDPNRYATALAEYGLSLETLVDNQNKRVSLARFFKGFENDILEIAGRERPNLIRYLEQEGCFDTDSVSFSDIGWDGSLQRAMAPILTSARPDIRISGYYVSTSVRIRRLAETGGTGVGWLVDGGLPEERQRIVKSGRALAELLFTANHGSVLSYREEGGRVFPSMAPVGITSNYVQAAEAIQDASTRFVSDYLRAFGGLPPVQIDRDDVFRAFTRLVDRPTVAEANAIGDLIHIDGFGATEAGQPIAGPLSFWQVISKPSAAVSRFLQAPWRLGVLVRILKTPKLVCAAMTLRRRLELRSRIG